MLRRACCGPSRTASGERAASGAKRHVAGAGTGAGAKHHGIESATRVQNRIAQRFGFQSAAGESGPQSIVRIDLRLAFADSVRGLLIGRRGEDQFVQVLQTPTATHELGGQPIEQFGMGRLFAGGAEVRRRGHQSPAKVVMPNTIDDHSGGQRVVGEAIHLANASPARLVAVPVDPWSTRSARRACTSSAGAFGSPRKSKNDFGGSLISPATTAVGHAGLRCFHALNLRADFFGFARFDAATSATLSADRRSSRPAFRLHLGDPVFLLPTRQVGRGALSSSSFARVHGGLDRCFFLGWSVRVPLCVRSRRTRPPDDSSRAAESDRSCDRDTGHNRRSMPEDRRRYRAHHVVQVIESGFGSPPRRKRALNEEMPWRSWLRGHPGNSKSPAICSERNLVNGLSAFMLRMT